MKTAFSILWRDVKLLLRNPIALLVVGALLVLPGLYAWYCIIANWDPYANTGNMPIAVVNEDVGANSELTGEINIGKQVIDQLKENDSIDWHFYDSEEKALLDTCDGTCYATIVFPETLSQDVIGIFSGSAAEPTLYYYPNQKYNAVATKVSDSAVQTLQRQINTNFAAQVNEKVLAAVQQGAKRAEDSAEKTQGSALSEMQRVQQDVKDVISSLDEALDSIANWRTAVVGGQQSLSGAAEQLPVIRDGLSDASSDLDLLNEKAGDFEARFSSALLDANQTMSSTSARATSRVAKASADAQELAGGVEGVIAQLRGFRDQVEEIADLPTSKELKERLHQLIDEVDATLAQLETTSQRVSDAAQTAGQKAEELNGTVQQATEDVDAASDTFSTQVMPKLSSGTDSLARAVSGLSSAVAQFEPQVGQLQEVLKQADDALDRAAATITQAKGLLQTVGDNLQATVADLGTMGSALQVENLAKLLDTDPDNVGQFISSPVHMQTKEVYPVSNYGTAVAPFYTNLALWVGCFILISIIRLEVDSRGFEGATNTQRYFGRWLLLIILALLQSQVICGVDILLGIDCANPALFMLSGAVASFAYMNLLFALVITFRNLGKTLCILLLIMQVPGSSGMYPIEMMPGFFKGIHPFLPFTYGIDAMREALCGMYGGAYYQDLLILLLLVPTSLLLGLWLRPFLMNLTLLFDTEMGKAGFFAVEEHGRGGDNSRIMGLVHALMNSDQHRDELEKRAWRFKRRYSKLSKAGGLALFIIPFAFLVLMLPVNLFLGINVDGRLSALAGMIVLVLLVSAAMIALEHTNRTIIEQTKIMGLSLMEDPSLSPDGLEGVQQGASGQPGAADAAAIAEAVDAGDALEAAVVADEEASSPNKLRGLAAWRHNRKHDTRKRHGAVREIFFTDVRLGFRSVIGAMVIMLLVITPSMYAWFNIAGSWDPYSNTGGLKVAVANEDTGYKGDLLPVTVNVGDTVVSQLRSNSSFDWQFVDESEAVNGINSGEYYASVVIPADFSKNMLTYIIEDGDYPDVFYYTNKKENPIAPLITQKGADSIQEGIRKNFSERIDEVGLSLASDMLAYLTQPRVSNFAAKMSTHLDAAVSDLQKGANEMRVVADLSGLTSGVVRTTGAAMDGIMAAAETGKESLGHAKSGVAEADAVLVEVGDLVDGVLSKSAGGLDTLAADADSALQQLENASADAPAALQRIYDRVDSWETDANDLKAIMDELAADPDNTPEERAELEAVSGRVGAIATALDRMRIALDQAIRNSEAAPDNIAALRAELKTLFAEADSSGSEARSFYQDNVKGAVDELRATVDSVSGSAQTVFGGLEDTVGGMSGSTGSLASQLERLSGQLAGAGAKLDSAALGISNAKNRVNDALSSKEVKTMTGMLVGADTTKLATRLSAPIQKHEEAMYPVANYGSSMAPFYTVLSLWVGALVMVSTMKVHLTRERSEELHRRYRMRPYHEYLGRFGIFALISLLQSALVSLGDLFLLRIQCVHPVLFVLMSMCIGLVFCLIVYTLSELFGDIGKALCVILLIMQVAASGGTFPVEMLGILQGAVPFLPFYYGMTALQACVAGIYMGECYLCLAVLFAFILGMALMGVIARRPFRFVTDWMEGQLEKTHFM